MFVPKGKGERNSLDRGQQIEVYNSENSPTDVRAILQTVDNTQKDLLKAGLRPNLDLVAYMSREVTITRGARVTWNASEYEVVGIEDQNTDRYRVLLVNLEVGNNDLDT